VTTDAELANLPEPPRRVIVVGASNVALGIDALIPCCHDYWGSPLDFFLVGGHGRALRHGSHVLGRVLPPVLQCQIWEELPRQPAKPTAVLVTDIGNDLLYGASSEEVLEASKQLVARLTPLADRLVVTGLPLESVSRISPTWYYRFRRWAFPSSSLEYKQAIEGAQSIHRGLARFPAQFNCYLMMPMPSWYGLDPVHVKRRYYLDAWSRFLAPWNDFRTRESKTSRRQRTSRWRWWMRLKPAERRWRRRDWSAIQPCHIDPRGSRYWVY